MCQAQGLNNENKHTPQRTDHLSAEQRSRLMSNVRHQDTEPELQVRRMADALGYSYDLHPKDLPGTPDIVFPDRRKAIFVHGCFWHGHDCKAGRPRPKSNQEYWSQKLAENLRRDAVKEASLRAQGWNVYVIWECETKNEETLRARIEAIWD